MIAPRSAWFSALRFSGRFSVTRRTCGAGSSMRTTSLAMVSAPRAGGTRERVSQPRVRVRGFGGALEEGRVEPPHPEHEHDAERERAAREHERQADRLAGAGA